MEAEEKRGCLKELKRLKRHYRKEYKESTFNMKYAPYLSGVADGLDLAIEVLENSGFYGK